MAEINPGLLTGAPNIQAPNLLVLQAAAAQGLLTDAEIQQLQGAANDRIRDLPVKAAENQAQMQDLKSLPIRRQQQLDLGNLQIQEGQENLKNLQDPTRLIQRKALSDTLGAYYDLHPGQAPPTDANGNVDLAAVNQQNIATQQSLQAQKDRIAAAKQLDEQQNAEHLKLFGNIPVGPDGQIDRKSRDTNLSAHGGSSNDIPEKATEQIEATEKAAANVANLEKLFAQRGGSENGFVQFGKGTLSSINPSDGNRKLIDAERSSAIQNVGAMLRSNSNPNAGSEKAVDPMLPSLTDTPAQVKSKLDRLKTEIASRRQIVTSDLAKSGKNVSRFQTPGTTTTAKPEAKAPLVTSSEDWAKLPPGAVYQTADGRLMRKGSR